MSEKVPQIKKTPTHHHSSSTKGILLGIIARLTAYTIVGSTIAGSCTIYPALRSRSVKP